MLPKGIRLSNPGNIERNPNNKWQGLHEDQTDSRFCRFKSDVWGLRALCVTLITYQDKYGIDTVSEAINRWCKHEGEAVNPVPRYIAHVAEYAKVAPKEPVDFHAYVVMTGVLRGIVTFENGPGTRHGRPIDWYPPEIYDEAMHRAGVLPLKSPKKTTDTMQTGAVATVGVAGAMEIGAKMLGATSERAQYMGATVLLVAVALSALAYQRSRKHRKAEDQ